MGIPQIKTQDLKLGREGISLTVYRLSRFFQVWDPEEFAEPHRIKFNALVYITAGAGEHYVDYIRYPLRPGTLLCLSKFQVHYFTANDSLDGFLVPFEDDLMTLGEGDPLANEINAAYLSVFAMDASGCGVAPLFETLFNEYGQGGEVSSEILRSLLRSILLMSVVREYRRLNPEGAPVRDDESFRQLVDLIEANFRISRNVSEYADKMCRSVKQINKLARDHSGSTVKQLIDARVVLELKRLLGYSNQAISSIAEESGFAEATNMTKFFRHHTDMTPTEYRNLCRSSTAARSG